jgi:hypothetical protein
MFGVFLNSNRWRIRACRIPVGDMGFEVGLGDEFEGFGGVVVVGYAYKSFRNSNEKSEQQSFRSDHRYASAQLG